MAVKKKKAAKKKVERKVSNLESNFVKYLTGRTKTFSTALRNIKAEKVVKLTKKDQAIVDFMDETDFGCYRNQTRGLVTLLTGIEFPKKKSNARLFPEECVVRMALVDLSKKNTHFDLGLISYQTNDGVVVYGYSEKLGKCKYSRIYNGDKDFKPATPSQIKKFAEEILPRLDRIAKYDDNRLKPYIEFIEDM